MTLSRLEPLVKEAAKKDHDTPMAEMDWKELTAILQQALKWERFLKSKLTKYARPLSRRDVFARIVHRSK